jgi:protein-S-isoprenylcysteine O-methyltransferase
LDLVLRAIRIAAVIAGVVVLAAPLAMMILFANRQVRTSTGSGSRFRRMPAVLLMSIGFVIVGAVLWKPLPLAFTAPLQLAITIVGGLVYFPAIGLYLWGMAALGRQFAVSSSFGADLLEGSALVLRGPYRFVRHPMYLGVILAAIGALLVFQTWAMAIFAPLSFVVIRRASHEETLLEAEYGDEWRAYALKVPKWFLRIR